MNAARYPHQVVVTLRESLPPAARNAKYEAPLGTTLAAAAVGEVVGGGSLLAPDGSVECIDLEVALCDLDSAVTLLRRTLKRLGAPGESHLAFLRDDVVVGLSLISGSPLTELAVARDALARRLIPAPTAARPRPDASGSGGSAGTFQGDRGTAAAPDASDDAALAASAQRTLALYQTLFVDSYTYGPIDPGAYDPAIFAWYNIQATVLGGLGYLTLGDARIVKDGGAPSGSADPFVRRFLAADGLTRADIFQMQSRKTGDWVRVVNLTSETAQQQFISTTTATQIWAVPDSVLLERHPPATDLVTLVQSHTRRCAGLAATLPGVRLRKMGSAQDALDSEHRQQAAAGAFRRRQAIPSPEELERLGSTPAHAARVHAELVRLRDGSGQAPVRAAEAEAAPAVSPASEWQVTMADLRAGERTPLTLDALIPYALDQGMRQVQAAGSPLQPFLLLDCGQAFFFMRASGDGDPMEVALRTLAAEGHSAHCCALVLDTRITLDDGTQCDAIVAMAAQRGAQEGETWAQGYRPKTWLRGFKALPLREKVAAARNLFSAAAPVAPRVP